MSYDSDGDSWVDKEGREYDLNIEDEDLDHMYEQNKLLKDCFDYARQDSQEPKNNIDTIEFFLNQELYDYCLKPVLDIITLDENMLNKEKQAM